MESSNETIHKTWCNNCILSKLTHGFLSVEEQSQICAQADKLTFSKGEVIIRQGTICRNIGFLHRGIVKFTCQREAGKTFIMTVASGPKLIGQANLFFGERNLFSIIAMEECEVCFLETNSVLAILETNGRLLIDLLKRSSGMFEASIFNFISLAHHQVYGRIAEILVFLWENVYQHSPYDFTMSRKEISEFAACSHENVIAVMSKFKREGLISLEGKRITILEPEKLKEISRNG